jgi:hypothetical protein
MLINKLYLIMVGANLKNSLKVHLQIYSLCILLLLIMVASLNCHVQLVAKYDQTAVDDIIHAYREIDSFYIDLLNNPKEQRKYSNYSKIINTIESYISVIVLKNSARPLNTESTKIAKSILESWRKHKEEFQNKPYSDDAINFDRDTFFDNFVSLLNAEQAKAVAE